MKKMKRIVALLTVAVMCILSVSVSAAIDKSAKYNLEFKFLNAEGNVIETAAPGEEVFLGVYFYNENGSEVTVAGANTSTFIYGIGVPAAVLPELAEMDKEDDYAANVVTGCLSALTLGTDDTAWITVELDATSDITSGASAPVSKVKFVLPEEEGEYEFIADDIVTSVSDTAGTAKLNLVSATIEVVAGPSVVNPTIGTATANGTDGVAITGTDKKYDNAIAVTSTITPGSATEIGMLFVPAKVNDWAKAAKATYGAALGNGDVTLVAALKNIPRALQGTAFDMLSKVYAVVDGAEVYGDVLTTTINFGSTGEVE